MSDDTTGRDLVQIEHRLWVGGADVYEEHLAEDALLVFPDPVGVLDRAATLAALTGPRWREVRFDDVRTQRLGADVATLSYAATATREGESEPYRTRASSVYARVDGRWRLALHQQSPAPG